MLLIHFFFFWLIDPMVLGNIPALSAIYDRFEKRIAGVLHPITESEFQSRITIRQQNLSDIFIDKSSEWEDYIKLIKIKPFCIRR